MNDQINKILQIDLLQGFNFIDKNSIDLLFADPPFNLNKKYRSTKDNLDEEIYKKWCYKWLTNCIEVLRPGGIFVLHHYPKWAAILCNFLINIADFGFWIVWDASTSPVSSKLQPSHYVFLVFYKRKKKPNFYKIRYPHKRCRKCGYLLKDYGGKKHRLHPFGPLASDIWNDIHRIRHKKYRDKKHPCQLPVHLLERIILMCSNKGDLVLDPFMGTGTTALASKKLDRNFIGFEIDKEYVELANSKLNKTCEVTKINNSYVSIFSNNIVTIRDIDWPDLKSAFNYPKNPKDIDHTCLELVY